MICPDCNGKKELFAFGIRYAPGHSGPPAIMLPCPRCGGEGTVPDEQGPWIELGRKMREERLARNEGLRQEAVRRGMLPSTLSRMEQDTIQPVPAKEFTLTNG